MVKNIFLYIILILSFYGCKKDFLEDEIAQADEVVVDVTVDIISLEDSTRDVIPFEHNGELYYVEEDQQYGTYGDFEVYKFNPSTKTFTSIGVIDLDNAATIRDVVSINGSLIVASQTEFHILAIAYDGWDISRTFSLPNFRDVISLFTIDDKFYVSDEYGYLYSGTTSTTSLGSGTNIGSATSQIIKVSNLYYFAASNGIYRSSDGTNWSKVKSAPSYVYYSSIIHDGTNFIVSSISSSYVKVEKYTNSFSFVSDVSHTAMPSFNYSSYSYDLIGRSFIINGYYLDFTSKFYNSYQSYFSEVVNVASDDIATNSVRQIRTTLINDCVYPVKIGNTIYAFDESSNWISALTIVGF